MVEQKANCVNCRQDFVPKIKSEWATKGVRRHYFACPHCEMQYTSRYVSRAIQSRQMKIRIRRKKIKNLAKGDIENRERLSAEIEKLAAENKKEMQELRGLLEGVS